MDGHRGETPSARLLVGYGAVVVALVALNLWLGLAYGLRPATSMMLSLIQSLSFAVAGIAAWRLRPRSRTGPWMLAMGIVALVAGLHQVLALPTELSGRELIVLVGVPADWLRLPIAAHLFLGYPSGRIQEQADRRLVRAAFVLAGTAAVALLITKTAVPICDGWCGRSPVQLVADPDLYTGVRAIFVAAWICVAVIGMVLLARRAVQASNRQRRSQALMLIAAALAIVLFVASNLTLLAVYAGRGSLGATALLQANAAWMAIVAVPIAFLLGLLRERLAFASVGELVRTLDQAGTDTVEAALADTLRDPELRVVFPVGGGWLDSAGQPFEPPENGTRTLTALGEPPIAALVHDSELTRDHELLEAAAATARLALDNARLKAEAQAAQRIIAAMADAEPKRLRPTSHVVFISYRREDTSGHALWLYDRLSARFGTDRIFMDVAAIPPGSDFVVHIEEAIGACRALVVLIGRRWTDATLPNGRRRLDDPEDLVRIEVEAALRRQIPVIPVLVQGARMPESAELPESIRALARHNALNVSDDRSSADVERLISALREEHLI